MSYSIEVGAVQCDFATGVSVGRGWRARRRDPGTGYVPVAGWAVSSLTQAEHWIWRYHRRQVTCICHTKQDMVIERCRDWQHSLDLPSGEDMPKVSGLDFVRWWVGVLKCWKNDLKLEAGKMQAPCVHINTLKYDVTFPVSFVLHPQHTHIKIMFFLSASILQIYVSL